MYPESDLLPISALQHLIFCERQCALIHIERLWTENVLTAEGRILHERTHQGSGETRGDLRVARGLPLRSLRLGIAGIADVVEFHRVAEPAAAETACTLPHTRGKWQPFPVEYKRGKPKTNNCDQVQLCAQALCLEETLNVKISSGALYYGTTKRRVDIQFDTALRSQTENAAKRLHQLINSGITPPPIYGKHCKSCSLIGECFPRTAGKKSARQYLDEAMKHDQETQIEDR